MCRNNNTLLIVVKRLSHLFVPDNCLNGLKSNILNSSQLLKQDLTIL